MAVLSESATVMERELLRKREEKANELANNEKLRANLLRSISHDLRTPLTSICGNADMLLQDKLGEEKGQKYVLIFMMIPYGLLILWKTCYL